MIIEKSVVDGNRYDVSADDYVAEGEITVTITLREYRGLVKTSVENKCRKDHEDWLEQYNRANAAEKRIKELEVEIGELRKKVADLCLQKVEEEQV